MMRVVLTARPENSLCIISVDSEPACWTTDMFVCPVLLTCMEVVRLGTVVFPHLWIDLGFGEHASVRIHVKSSSLSLNAAFC